MVEKGHSHRLEHLYTGPKFTKGNFTFAFFLCIHQPSMSVFFPQTPAEITSTPYSRQMQLWPMMRSTLCPCRTSTPRRWRWTRCSATATSPGDLEAASWVSSKRWRGNFGPFFFAFPLDYYEKHMLITSGDHGDRRGLRTAQSSGTWIFIHQINPTHMRNKAGLDRHMKAAPLSPV